MLQSGPQTLMPHLLEVAFGVKNQSFFRHIRDDPGSLMEIDTSGQVWGKLPGHLRSPAWSSQKQESLFLFRIKPVYRLGMA